MQQDYKEFISSLSKIIETTFIGGKEKASRIDETLSGLTTDSRFECDQYLKEMLNILPEFIDFPDDLGYIQPLLNYYITPSYISLRHCDPLCSEFLMRVFLTIIAGSKSKKPKTCGRMYIVLTDIIEELSKSTVTEFLKSICTKFDSDPGIIDWFRGYIGLLQEGIIKAHIPFIYECFAKFATIRVFEKNGKGKVKISDKTYEMLRLKELYDKDISNPKNETEIADNMLSDKSDKHPSNPLDNVEETIKKFAKSFPDIDSDEMSEKLKKREEEMSLKIKEYEKRKYLEQHREISVIIDDKNGKAHFSQIVKR